MGTILDVILIAIIAIFVFIGAKRGFAKTAVETVGFFLSVYLAFTFCTPIATAISDSTIRPAVISGVAQTISETKQTGASDATQKVWDALPEYIQNLAQKANVTPDNLADYLGGAVSDDTVSIATAVTDNVVMPLVYNFVKIITAVILFILLLVATKILSVLISRVFKLPILNGINSSVGAVVGGVQGVLFAVVFCIIVSAVISVNSKGFLIFTTENINASALFKWLCNLSPFN